MAALDTAYVPEDRYADLSALACLFADPGLLHGDDTLDADVARACDDPSHDPAYAAVSVMMSLFPGLVPEAAFAPTGP